MAASAADIRSALSIPNTPAPTQPQKKQNATSTKKPDGISRELYSLIGPSAPSLAAQLAKPRLKQKPNFGSGSVKWEMREFKNGARSDGLELRHWVKATTDPEADYPFAKYNAQPSTYDYTQEEYVRFLEDLEWTKEETDYLFALIRDYDLRWYIIHDRYEYPGSTRSMEDLKDRYFSVCRKLVRNRPWSGDETSKNLTLSSFQFDKERELTRKKYILSLDGRTPDQIAEEEALYVEIKRLEQNERRFKKDRDDLLRLLAGIDSGLPEVVEDDPSGLTSDIKKKKKGSMAMDLDSPSTPLSASIPMIKRIPSTKNAAEDALHCIVRSELPPPTSATKAAHPPAFLRSFKIPYPKTAIAPKVVQTLSEIGISHNRLVMPTRHNCALLESLLDQASTLVETKRMVDKLELDARILKTRLGMKDDQDMEAPPPSASIAGGDIGMDMDEPVEGGEAETEEGRAQSVVSTRSARSRDRKHPRGRSMSISSVDTSVAAATRAGTKRQKRS
ncbi:hypothetical protein BDN72DRAFT_409014 [Pluteus cervinus]|uniref:Uncharacterized protein n=1 Tax=Pluteus cervinus TaxID=181527 RepID=A0ACD3B2H6_9AGAR|nr:hypothetical protein BDN72DRAFT_409014 [Pluteus cervinus]